MVIGLLVGRVDNGETLGKDLLEHEVVGLLVLGYRDGTSSGSRGSLSTSSELLNIADDESMLGLGRLERLDELLGSLVAVLNVAEGAADKGGRKRSVRPLKCGGDVHEEGGELGGSANALLENSDALDTSGDDLEQALWQRRANQSDIENSQVIVRSSVVLKSLGASTEHDGKVGGVGGSDKLEWLDGVTNKLSNILVSSVDGRLKVLEAGLAGSDASVAIGVTVGAVDTVRVTVDAVGLGSSVVAG